MRKTGRSPRTSNATNTTNGPVSRFAAVTAAVAIGATMFLPAANAQSAGIPPDVAQAAVTATGSGASEPQQHAPEGGARLVTLGDSVMAGTTLPLVDGGNECFRSSDRYVSQIARSIGVYNTPDFQDTSCFGATLDSPPILTLVDQAAHQRDRGSFGPRTEHVLIQAGLNDKWGNPDVDLLDTALNCAINIAQGCDMNAVGEGRAQDPDAVTAQAYADRARTAVDYIKYYAPNAKISFVGYPTYATDDRTCISIGGLPAEQPRDEAITRLFNNMQEAQRGAAEQLGVNFIDLKTPSAAHGGCTAEPWVSGILDPASGHQGVPVHLNPVGDHVVAGIVQSQM